MIMQYSTTVLLLCYSNCHEKIITHVHELLGTLIDHIIIRNVDVHAAITINNNYTVIHCVMYSYIMCIIWYNE